MAPRKKTNFSGRKTKKIKSKKTPARKNKLPKRNTRKTAPSKKSKPKRLDPDEIEDEEFKEWLGHEVYTKLYKAKKEFVPDLPLEELYYDNREIFSSSDFSDDDQHEIGTYDDLKTDDNSLKRRLSSSNDSVVERYLKLGSNHVASFIVESAIRFGQEQGVVIPEEGNKDVYQISSPFSPYFDIDDKKIRFRVPSKTFGYEDAKKAMWKRRKQKKPLHLAKSRRFQFDVDTKGAIREKERFLEMETLGESSSDSDHKNFSEMSNRKLKRKNTQKMESKNNDDYFSESDFADKENSKIFEPDSCKEENRSADTGETAGGASIGT